MMSLITSNHEPYLIYDVTYNMHTKPYLIYDVTYNI